MFKRARFSLIVLVFSLLPLLVSWQSLNVVSEVRSQTATMAREIQKAAAQGNVPGAPSPNPPRTPDTQRGLAESLVAVEPWFGGTIWLWIIFWPLVLIGYAIAAGVLRHRPPKDEDVAQRQPYTYVVTAMLLGTWFAAPWLFGTYLVLTR